VTHRLRTPILAQMRPVIVRRSGRRTVDNMTSIADERMRPTAQIGLLARSGQSVGGFNDIADEWTSA
jgi:hypothetical protein